MIKTIRKIRPYPPIVPTEIDIMLYGQDIPCSHLERYRTGTNCSGTVWIGTETRASIPVPERDRSTCPHDKLSGPNCTRIVCSGAIPTKYWVSDWFNPL